MADDDLWHVRLAPDEVKQLTLEQLDDLFRLEVIEASTLIWQPGMTEWLPLSVVAGLGEEEPEEVVSIAVSEPPAPTHRMAQTATTWPPRAEPAASWPPQARSAPPRSLPPPPSTRSATPPPRSATPAPRSAPPPPRPPAPVAPSLPPSWSNPPPRPAPVSAHASTVAVAQPARSAPPPSVAPPRYVDPFASPPTSIAPMAAPSFGDTQVYQQGGGGWIVALAFAAGLAVTLYRNDIVHAAARNIGQESSYLKLEQALGGPSFGTPRAVATMAAAAAAITVSPPAAASPPAVAPTVTSTADTPSAPAVTSTATTAEPTTPASAAKPAEPAPTARTEPAAAPRSAPAHRPASNHQASEPVDSVFKTPKKGKKAGKGSEYDPLNPSL
jgi:hypothetical protein